MAPAPESAVNDVAYQALMCYNMLLWHEEANNKRRHDRPSHAATCQQYPYERLCQKQLLYVGYVQAVICAWLEGP